MPIHPLAFANALAITSALLAVLLGVLKATAPSAFVFVFNAQFFGADVTSLLPAAPSLGRIMGEMVAFVGGAWGFGLVGVLLYNRLISPSSAQKGS